MLHLREGCVRFRKRTVMIVQMAHRRLLTGIHDPVYRLELKMLTESIKTHPAFLEIGAETYVLLHLRGTRPPHYKH
ncbi:MAG TPA: hypothetical protein VI055_03145 [Rubrobacter sp.]